MRLINARTLQMEEVWHENAKEYSILLHRWLDHGEVSFQNIQNLEVASTMEGFAKIQKSCEHAVKDGFDYVWVDTCCINKESSAELSKSINSMFRWYKALAVCYAFLSDADANVPSRYIVARDIVEEQIKSSKWFTRGWTLKNLSPLKMLSFMISNGHIWARNRQ